MSRKPTMAELARIAEVDASTVSRALAGSPRVKEATKEHIRRVAEEIGYEINVSARNLRKRSTETIGIVVPIDPTRGQTISDPFYLEMLGAVSAAAAKRGYDLLLTIPQSDEKVAERRLLTSGKVDGLIIIGQAGRKERLNALAQSTDRIVVWGGILEDARYTIVGSDNIEGGRQAVRHLLSLGRKRVLFIGDRALPEVALRHDGLVRAHEELGVPLDPSLYLPLGFGAPDTAREVRRLIEEGVSFDAVFAASDVLAIAAMSALREAGLSIPGDVAVVGYDNIGASSSALPPLTTVSQHIGTGGELMVELLLRKIRGEEAASRLTPTELIVRQSTH
ncbi:LacI family DNA-binding transcriptional regulator [Parvularcula maris]|uniref:LacI family DNA-binding transcriptional regulator n=1 Tax=Parvularcula maris TaxID=2965077 RepID=A0A9X2RJE7_9PROT|nr:LacI family DNA-binding transcriptional regulator [Parvularcula maris]MCQ8184623.1 LacI family DNA-binding transcriptional regulator [Parvularcula maris]